jgi:hypothetical protein
MRRSAGGQRVGAVGGITPELEAFYGCIDYCPKK